MLTLQLVGAVAIAVLLVAGYFAWRFFASSRSQKKQDAAYDMAVSLLPNVELELETSSPNGWVHKDNLEQDEAKLEKEGLVHQGYFVIQSPESAVELSLWQYQQTVAVALYDTIPDTETDDIHSFYCSDVMVKLDDGGTLTISNSEYGSSLPRPERHRIVNEDTPNIFKLMRSLKEHTPADSKVVPIKNCKDFFVESYEDVSEWVWQESQLVSGQLQGALEQFGIELSDDVVDRLVSFGQSNLSGIYSNRILSRLSKSPKMTGDKWEGLRERLVVVHEKMDAEDITDIMYRLATNISDDQEQIIEAFSSSGQLDDPIGSFGELMESLNPGAKRIAKMQKPITSEIYLAE